MARSLLNSRSLYHRAAFAALCIVISGGPADAKATYTTFDSGYVTSINSVDTVTGFTATQGFVRTVDGTVATFDVPGGNSPEPAGINSGDVVTGRYFDASGNRHGFVRAADGTVATFDGPDATDTEAHAINDKGEVTGFYRDGAGDHGFTRNAAGKLRTFDGPNALETYGSSVNDKGGIAGYYIDSRHSAHGFLRTADGTITTIDVLGANGGTFATAINSQGVITGYYYNGNGDGEHGFVRLSDGTIATFDEPGCDITPISLNRKGVITGFCQDRDNPRHTVGFVRKPDGKMKEFHVPGGKRTMPMGINDAGVIAGYYSLGGFLRFP